MTDKFINYQVQSKTKTIMFNNILKISIFALIIVLQSCSTPQLEVSEITVKVGEGFKKAMQEYSERLERNTEKLEQSDAFKVIEKHVITEFSDNKSSSTFSVSLHLEDTFESEKDFLESKGREASLLIISALENKEQYDNYEVKFFADADSDLEDDKNCRSFVYKLNQLIQN